MKKIFGPERPSGIQLWSLKEEMALDAFGTIKTMAGAGYQRIELFEGEQGMFWGVSPMAFSTFVHDLGLEMKSAHCDPFSDFERKVEAAATVGLEYLVCAWLGPHDELDFYKRALDRFVYCADYCAAHGLKFAYHNHDYSLKSVEGVVPQELFLTQTDPNQLYFEMDIYWVIAAGQDPITWMDNHLGRWPMVHLKDMAKNKADGQQVSSNIGEGSISYPQLLPMLLEAGVDDFYVEQEYFDTLNPLEAARANFKYLSALEI